MNRGRTKLTEDGWPASRMYPGSSLEESLNEAYAAKLARDEEKRLRRPWNRLYARYSPEDRRWLRRATLAVVAVAALAVGSFFLATWMTSMAIDHDWDHKVQACTDQMQADQTGPLPACEKLDEDARKEAAYRWAEQNGLW